MAGERETGDMIQDTELVREIMDDQARMEGERAPWEARYRDADRRVDPVLDGGFDKRGAGDERGLDNFDETAVEGLDKFTAAIAGMTIPQNQKYIGFTTTDQALNEIPSVKRWLEVVGDRVHNVRYAAFGGFETQAHEDIRQLGSYGTAGFWTEEWAGRGIFYKSIHLSELWIDEDFRGRVDTTHRKFCLTAQKAEQQFGRENLSDKLIRALDGGKRGEEFEFLHVIHPNRQRRAHVLSHERMPICSYYIATDEKWLIRRGGYRTMPMAVSRHVTSPRDKYGRSPAMKVMGTIKTLNEMAKTILRAGHKAVDPALAFFDDGDVSKLATKPGGLNPGLVDEFGRLLVQAIPGGGDLNFGIELLTRAQGVVERAFLSQVFQVLENPGDRWTATQILEMVQKQGVLVAPFAGRYMAEKENVRVMREFDILEHARQIPPRPPEMIEAGIDPIPVYNNPLARMARAEEAAGFTRLTEVAVQLAPFDEAVVDVINVEAGLRSIADVLGVRSSIIRTPDEVKARQAARAQAKQEQEVIAQAPDAAKAVLDFAKAGQISEAA